MSEASAVLEELDIAPQPGPQTVLLACDATEILYGGALGSGKSYGLVLDFLTHHQQWGKHVSGICLRQSVPELEDLIKTFKEVLLPLDWEYKVGRKTFIHPDGAELRMRHCESEVEVRKYWGHQYCVGKGTPVLMADKSYKLIEDIQVGESVMTLEGPKVVTEKWNPGKKECVLAEIFDMDGVKLGEQIQPSNHPLLSNVSELAEQSHRSSEALGKLPQQSFPAWSSYKSLLGEYQANQVSDAYSKDDSNCRANIEQSTREFLRLPALSCPVVLHAPSVRLALKSHQHLSIQNHSLHKFSSQSLAKLKARQAKPSGLLQPFEPSQQFQASVFYKTVDDISCGPLGSETASNSRLHCSSDLNQCGEPLLRESNNVQVVAPSVACAVAPNLDDQQQDDKDNILQCNRQHSPVFAYSHPYTAKLRDVVETVQIGSCVMTPVGDREVFDLCVEDANHYITAPACVSKNSWMGVDEYGDFDEQGFDAVQKLRAGRLRSAAGVKTRFVATANPCGQGHEFCKARYIDPSPAFTPHLDPRSKHSIVFIPGSMEDNLLLLQNDPEYPDRIRSMGPDWYVQALKEGNWNISPQGEIFKREQFENEYDPNNLPPFLFTVFSLDTAFKTTKDSARSALTFWGVTKTDYYLLFAWAKKVEFPELKSMTETLYDQLNPNAVWIEEKASGMSLTQEFKRNTRIPVRAIKVDGDKLRRAFAVSPLFDTGKILLPKYAIWKTDYVNEMCGFPKTTYKDYVDSTSQALTEIIKYMKKRERFTKIISPITGSIYGV